MNFSRQTELIPEESHGLKIALIGLGGIGSHVLVTLSKMGFNNVEAWEHDILGEENLGGGLFDSRKVGKPKTDAVASLCLITSGTKQKLNQSMYTEESDQIDADIVILAVDSFKGRADIYDAMCKNESKFRYLIDSRMGGHSFNVFSMPGEDLDAVINWRQLLDREDPPLPCGMKSTAYVSSSCANSVCASVVAIANNRAPFACQIIDYATNQTIFQ